MKKSSLNKCEKERNEYFLKQINLVKIRKKDLSFRKKDFLFFIY